METKQEGNQKEGRERNTVGQSRACTCMLYLRCMKFNPPHNTQQVAVSGKVLESLPKIQDKGRWEAKSALYFQDGYSGLHPYDFKPDKRWQKHVHQRAKNQSNVYNLSFPLTRRCCNIHFFPFTLSYFRYRLRGKKMIKSKYKNRIHKYEVRRKKSNPQFLVSKERNRWLVIFSYLLQLLQQFSWLVSEKKIQLLQFMHLWIVKNYGLGSWCLIFAWEHTAFKTVQISNHLISLLLQATQNIKGAG